MPDFFLPNKNETELAAAAKDFGIEEYVYLYPPDKYMKGEKNGVILSGKYTLKDIFRAKKLSQYVVLKARGNLREVFEKVKKVYVYGAEFSSRSDYLHFRNSGLNHIMMNIAAKNKISLILNFGDFLASTDQSRILGRLKQNIKLCRKYNVEFSVATFAVNQYDLKNSFESFLRIIERNRIP
jgi:hypothetical protein